MKDPGAVISGETSNPLGSVLYVIGVMFAANVKVIDGYGLSTRGGMSSARRRGQLVLRGA